MAAKKLRQYRLVRVVTYNEYATQVGSSLAEAQRNARASHRALIKTTRWQKCGDPKDLS